MSSVPRAPSNTKQGNDFFINVTDIATGSGGDIWTYTESTNSMVNTTPYNTTAYLGTTTPYTAGTLLVKDLGKTVTVNGARYRKVQAFNIPAGYTGDVSLANLTFYILLNPATGNGCDWARMTLQA